MQTEKPGKSPSEENMVFGNNLLVTIKTDKTTCINKWHHPASMSCVEIRHLRPVALPRANVLRRNLVFTTCVETRLFKILLKAGLMEMRG